MLRPILKSAVGLLVALLISGTSAFAGPTNATDKKLPPKPVGDYVPVCSPTRCWWAPRSVVEILDTTANAGKQPAKSKATAQKPVCHDGATPQKCTTPLGSWSNSQRCYLQSLIPQPPYSDPVWQGHTDGAVWACVRELGYDEGKHLVTKWVWLPGRPDIVQVDPATLAYRAIAEMRLAPPLIQSAPAPGQVGLVNMPVWLWVNKTENTWGPIVKSASVPGLSVTATAQVKAVNWTLGDGNRLRCEGPGTPYTTSMGIKDSPDCGHRYNKTSSKLANCKYPVTASAQWQIDWQSTLGDTGQISMTQQAATGLRIGEAVPVLVDPGGAGVVGPAEGVCGG
jgi:hypothetical protein